MRSTLALAAAVLGLTLPRAPALAVEGAAKLELEVGQRKVVGGDSGMCDDLSVASISLNEPATIVAVKPGRTICSSRVLSVRRIYEVTVKAPAPGEPEGSKPSGEGERRPQ